jgi:transposase-like protein
MEAELDTQLGYAKHDTKNKKTSNSRNGKMPVKTVMTVMGDFYVRTPRDRESDFEPQIVKNHQNDLSGLERQIISIYAKDMSRRDIQANYNHIYGVNISCFQLAHFEFYEHVPRHLLSECGTNVMPFVPNDVWRI